MVGTLSGWIEANRKELNRFLKFSAVGVTGTVVDFGLLYVGHVLLGLPLVIANTISFTTAVINNFTWNRYWTYPDSRSKPIHHQLGQFFVVNIAGWAINTGILLLLNHPLTALAMRFLTPWFSTETIASLGYNLAKLAATAVVLFWNFFVNRFWTYNDVD